MRRLTRGRGVPRPLVATAPRRRVRPDWRRRATPMVLIGLAAALVIGSPVWMWRSGVIDAAINRAGRVLVESTGAAGLKVAAVLVDGRVRTTRAQVLAALDIRRGAPLLGLDPTLAKRRLEDLLWVERAVVERRLPDTVYVRIDERRPLVVWQNHGRFAVVGHDGRSIPGAEPRRFKNLLQVVGPGAAAKAPQLVRMLASEPTLKARVAAAVLVSGRRWNLLFNTGVDVRLPAEGADLAWSRLARLQNEHRILARDLLTIDMRQPDRLLVRLTPEAAKRHRAKPDDARRPPDET